MAGPGLQLNMHTGFIIVSVTVGAVEMHAWLGD